MFDIYFQNEHGRVAHTWVAYLNLENILQKPTPWRLPSAPLKFAIVFSIPL